MEVEEYVYTPGLHGLEMAKRLVRGDAIVATRCGTEVYIPPTTFCPDLEPGEVVEVPLDQPWTVKTYTVVYRDLEGRPLREPRIIALLVPEEPSNVVGGLVHYVRADPAAIYEGMRVKPRLKPERERRGLITDIEFFEPA
jgi:uncharacterized OB-fold protein